MNAVETLLACVCLLASLAGLSVMAGGWQDRTLAGKAAEELDLAYRSAASAVLARRSELAQKAAAGPLDVTDICPETARGKNDAAGQPYAAWLISSPKGKLSLALFAKGSGQSPEFVRRRVLPAARRVESGFVMREDGRLHGRHETLDPASLCTGCAALASTLPAGSWGVIRPLPEEADNSASAAPSDGLVARLAAPGENGSRMEAHLKMDGHAVTGLSELTFGQAADGSGLPSDASAFRAACRAGSLEGGLAYFREEGLMACSGGEALPLLDSLSGLLLREASRPDIEASTSALSQSSAPDALPEGVSAGTGTVSCPQGMIPAVWSAPVFLHRKTAVRRTADEVLGAPSAGYSGNYLRLRLCLHQ